MKPFVYKCIYAILRWHETFNQAGAGNCAPTNLRLAITAVGYILHCAGHFSLLLLSEEDKSKETENKRGF